MSTKKPHAKPITQALNDSQGALGQIVRAMHQHHELTALLQTQLPPECHGNVRVLTFKEGVLRIGATNQAIAAKLRFMKSDILSTLRQSPQWCGIGSIEVSVL